jgi:hypothetical protein
MSADPALGDYLPGAGKTGVSLPGMGGAFRPANLVLYGYGHQNPATLWDPDGGEVLVCTPQDIHGDRPAFEFRNISNDYAKAQADRVNGNTMGMRFGGFVAVLPMAARLFGFSEDVVESAPLITPRNAGPVAGRASSVTAAMRRPAASVRLRNPATGRFVSDPANPPSPFEFTDAQRRAAWKNLANDPNSSLTDAERAQIQERGWRGPQRTNPLTGEIETMELSHEPKPLREGGTQVVPRWPADHASVDPYRQLKR